MGSLRTTPNEDGRITCEFCDGRFTSKGVYGRHLDRKKGDALHPEEMINQIRGSVARRRQGSENREMERAHTKRRRKSERAKMYNQQGDVRERNKQRRRQRDWRIKAQLRASEWMLARLSNTGQGGQGEGEKGRGEGEKGIREGEKGIREGEKGGGEREKGGGEVEDDVEEETRTNPDGGTEIVRESALSQNTEGKIEATKIPNFKSAQKFADAVARVVPPASWPSLGKAPGEKELTAALSSLAESDTSAASRVLAHYAHWHQLGASEKLDIWQRSQDSAIRASLGRNSLDDICHAQSLVREKMCQLMEEYANGDIFDILVSDNTSENEGEA